MHTVKSRYLLLLLAAFPLSAADPVSCPAQVQVRQQLAAPVPGWSPGLDKLPNALAGITFFDGKPEENASLAPDKQSRVGGKDVLVWTFDPASSRPTFLACRYANTSVTLQRELPKTVRSCTVTYNPREMIGGMPVIEKIDCK